jgi:hypothetical protein
MNKIRLKQRWYYKPDTTHGQEFIAEVIRHRNSSIRATVRIKQIVKENPGIGIIYNKGEVLYDVELNNNYRWTYLAGQDRPY